ncbi:hypothetical protein [Streptomyces sp. AC555_RSS877]|uniref:hypothetical protein n=1 Tax=Streptomyces sp. AC555_RSS877 TaxID=2823688 RepID=UPI001C25D17B|nr:hypothetical protein [Streptomyces sp. AC555_RSS877]
MNDHTPSQAEGEPEETDTRNTADGPAPDHPTPSQAEGDRDDADDTGGSGAGS